MVEWSRDGKQYGRLTRSGTRFQPLLSCGKDKDSEKSAQFSTQLKANFTKPGLGGLWQVAQQNYTKLMLLGYNFYRSLWLHQLWNT